MISVIVFSILAVSNSDIFISKKSKRRKSLSEMQNQLVVCDQDGALIDEFVTMFHPAAIRRWLQ